MSSILYYSNACVNSKRLLQKISTAKVRDDMHFVCVDKRTRKPKRKLTSRKFKRSEKQESNMAATSRAPNPNDRSYGQYATVLGRSGVGAALGYGQCSVAPGSVRFGFGPRVDPGRPRSTQVDLGPCRPESTLGRPWVDPRST